MIDDELTQMKMDLDPNSPQDQALVWVSRLATGEADAKALADFERWRDADPRNEKALHAARRLWLMMGEPLQAQYSPQMASLPATPLLRPRPARSRNKHWAMSVAAGLMLALTLGGYWQRDWRYDQSTHTGEQRAITLRDGSTMWLNTDSAADVQVDQTGRHIRLARGEAYFNVAHDPAHPFTVEAGSSRITVLGTAFAVRRVGQDALVTVQRGRVRVAGGTAPPVVVTADQQVWVRPSDQQRGGEAVVAEQALSWRVGRLQFENRHIREVLNEIQRYERRFVLVSYPDADRLRVSSSVDLARIDEWYDTLEQSLPVKVTRMGPVVWIHGA